MSLKRRRIQRSSVDDEMGDRRVVARRRRRSGCAPDGAWRDQLPDHAAVGDTPPRDRPGGRPRSARAPPDPSLRPRCDSAPGIDVPALLGHMRTAYSGRSRHLLPEQAALPLPEAHLAQVGLDHRRQPQPRRQRCRRLGGAPQRRHVDRVDRLVGQSVADQLGLPARPSGASGGSPWPSTRGNGLPVGTARTHRAGRGRSRSLRAAAESRSGGTRPRRADPARRSPAGPYRSLGRGGEGRGGSGPGLLGGGAVLVAEEALVELAGVVAGAR